MCIACRTVVVTVTTVLFVRVEIEVFRSENTKQRTSRRSDPVNFLIACNNAAMPGRVVLRLLDREDCVLISSGQRRRRGQPLLAYCSRNLHHLTSTSQPHTTMISRLVHYTADAVLLSTFLAGVKRTTGYT